MSAPDASRWLLFLGAGASAANPSGLPAFPALATGVLCAIGWAPSGDNVSWTHPRYGSFATEGMAPEVLFGTLTRFGVSFARQVAVALDRGAPNAVHEAAAAVLAAGGCVWTTNVDRLVEAACATAPHRAGMAARRGVLEPLISARPGTLVKFHGTAEAPETLAFTDRELLAPPAASELAHLAHLAAGRNLVVYGYAGADADLYDLLDASFAGARQVLWFEPVPDRRREIVRAFPAAPVRFVPDDVPTELAPAIEATARAFVQLAREAGIVLSDTAVNALQQAGERPPPPKLSIRQPPAITHARLVERFGAAGADRRALAVARRVDATHLRVDAVPGHLRWTLSRSLYGGGVVARIIDWLAVHRTVLARLWPSRVRDYAITRGHALRLQRRDWEAVDELASWAVEHRPGGGQPTDYYYRAHARRYALRIADGVRDADEAASGLSAAADPERHAGAVLERGCLAIYQGDIERALREGFELRQRTGRYAIPRWRAWGAWLEGVALCHAGRPDEAAQALSAARPRFESEGLPGPIADLRTATLLVARVRLAGGSSTAGTAHDDLADAEELGGRYVDDRRLVLADLALARGDVGTARALLRRVADAPSCPVASAWAALGLAEIRRLEGDAPGAGAELEQLARLAHQRGAWWLQAQAAIALELCGGPKRWHDVPDAVRRAASARRDLGDPRVLWMMTV